MVPVFSKETGQIMTRSTISKQFRKISGPTSFSFFYFLHFFLFYLPNVSRDRTGQSEPWPDICRIPGNTEVWFVNSWNGSWFLPAIFILSDTRIWILVGRETGKYFHTRWHEVLEWEVCRAYFSCVSLEQLCRLSMFEIIFNCRVRGVNLKCNYFSSYLLFV